jgi:Gas vesicle synthesis protein GvpL/GvpF
MIWLYALTDNSSVRLPAITGHRAQELGQTRVRDVAGVWSAWSQTDADASAEDSLWRQEAVLEALMRHRTVLPLRYGTILQDDGGVKDLIVSRHEEWVKALSAVRGCFEMAVRAGVRSSRMAPKRPDESGTEYLRRRARERASALALTGTVHARLVAVSRASDAPPSAAAAQFTASYLVPRADVAAFRGAVAALAEEDPELAIACTGPWPPYSFVPPGGRPHDRRAVA